MNAAFEAQFAEILEPKTHADTLMEVVMSAVT